MAIEDHMNMFFTKKGFDILYTYTQSLIKLWHKQKAYPFVLGIILGIPSFKNTNKERIFNNKSELEGRIKGYMQLMCVQSIEVELGTSAKLIFKLRG